MNSTTSENTFIALAKDNEELHDPIFDGIVDECRFKLAPIKILWILKEPWENLEDNEKGGGWSVTRDLLLNGEFENNKGSYPPMAYVSYSIANGFLNYADTPYLMESDNVRDALRTLAYINIKKFPGGTTSEGIDIQSYYTLYEDFLINQIEDINPEVVIFGGTHYFFQNKLSLNDMSTQSDGPSFANKNGRLYIAAYHPNQRTISKDSYVDGIVNTIKLEYAKNIT